MPPFKSLAQPRRIVQVLVALICLWIGLEFHLFMRWAQSGGQLPFVERPPGVDAFLPISSLMSLKLYFQSGEFNTIHPAGLVIFIAILLTALLMKKAFCGWMCPFGFLGECLSALGKRIFKRSFALPNFLDMPMRAIKYLLLGFFLWAISQMSLPMLEAFIQSPYNRVADLKMYLFFRAITPFALSVILVLALLSLFIHNFWCRYLCPYGALLGFLSFFSPLKITRNAKTCVDCQACTRACPSRIQVHSVGRVRCDECIACYACVKACPVPQTLEMKARESGRALPPWGFALLLAGLFCGITGYAMFKGKWQNQITREEYLWHMNHLEKYDHFKGRPQQLDSGVRLRN